MIDSKAKGASLFVPLWCARRKPKGLLKCSNQIAVRTGSKGFECEIPHIKSTADYLITTCCVFLLDLPLYK